MSKRIQKSWGVQAATVLLFVFFYGLMQGCATLPTRVAAPIPPKDIEGYSSIASGRKIYVSLLKCGMCHRPKSVTDYTAEAWSEDILPRMSKKARLTPQQYADVLAYVSATTTPE